MNNKKKKNYKKIINKKLFLKKLTSRTIGDSKIIELFEFMAFVLSDGTKIVVVLCIVA